MTRICRTVLCALASGTVEARGVRNGREVRFAMKTSGRVSRIVVVAEKDLKIAVLGAM